MKRLLLLVLTSYLLVPTCALHAQVNDSVSLPPTSTPSVDQMNREAVKSANKARADRNKQDASNRNSYHEALYGRSGTVTFNPGATLFFARTGSARQNLGNGYGFNVNAELNYHHPLSSSIDIAGGLGYRYGSHIFDHDIYFNGDKIMLNPSADGLRSVPTLITHTVYLPIRMTLVVPVEGPRLRRTAPTATEWYLGLAPGLSVASHFSLRHIEADGTVTDNYELDKIEPRNSFRLDVLLGFQRRWLIFAPGVELFFNLIPTFKEGVETTAQIHEFGLRAHL